MRKFLFLLALICSSAFPAFSQTVYSGFCLPGSSDNLHSSTLLTNFGVSVADATCWQGLHANDSGIPMPLAGTLKHLFVTGRFTDGGSAPANWNVQVQIYVNGTPQAVTCTMVLSGGSATVSTASCSDVTNTVTVALGDVVSVQMSTSGITCNSVSCPVLGLYASFKQI